MKGKKIMATVIAMAMVLSVIVVVNNLTDVKMVEKAGADLGVDSWEWDASADADFVNTSTASLYYNNDLDIQFNMSILNGIGSGNYYLYYPVYSRASGATDYEYNVTWTKWTEGGEDRLTTEGKALGCHLDVAGPWFVSDQFSFTKVNLTNRSVYNSGWKAIVGMFWVNSTEKYTVSVSPDSINYDRNQSVTITVTQTGTNVDHDVWVDIRKDNTDAAYDDYVVKRKQVSVVDGTGTWEISGTNMYDYTHAYGAGTYNIIAYRNEVGAGDFAYGSASVHTGYNASFGNLTAGQGWDNMIILNSTGQESTFYEATYNHTTCGPFDPPEYTADMINLTMVAGVPTFTVTNGTQFWNDTADNEVKIKITDYDGNNMSYNGDVTVDVAAVQLYNKSNKPTRSGSSPIPNILTLVNISLTGTNQDILQITPKGPDNRWGYNDNGETWAARGTVYVVWANSSKENATEEWNGTATFELVRATDQFKWIDDGSTDVTADTSTDDTDGVLGAIPVIGEVPVTVRFKIINSDYNYFGSLPGDSGSCATERACAENITISGDSLFTGTLDKLPGYGGTWFDDVSVWSVPIIPTMSTGGGEIKIIATAWNKTITGTLSIGGTNYWQHGSVVSVDPNDFMIDQEDQELTITVKDAKGNMNPYATVSLLYVKDGTPYYQHNLTSDGGFVADENGAYTWNFNITQQTTNQTNVVGWTRAMAPRNLTAYVDASNAGYGYALIQMTKVNDLEVELSRTTMLAGMRYDDFAFDCTFAGNSTEYPNEDDKANFFIEIYDEDGTDVTDTLLGGIDSGDLTNDADYSFLFDGVYATVPGTYTVYAYNDTHDSTGHNATLVVEQVQVGCNIAGSGLNTFIWSSDENVSATFTATYNGEPVNGTLRIDNMSSVSHADGDYNATWKNCSFDKDDGDDPAAAGNTSIEIAEDSLVNGVVTVHDITANYLNVGEAEQYISFYFMPTNADDEEGEWAIATGQAIVTVPTVTFDGEDSSGQKYIAKGDSDIEATITGRGSPLSGIFLRLHGQGVDQNGISDADGEVSFSVTSTSTGNISIDVGEEGRTIDKVIVVTNWKLDISAPIEVNEGTEFTVTVIKKGTTTAVEGATVTIDGIGTGTTDSSGQAKFTKATVTSDRGFDIDATKTGYADATKKITIINVPSLSIALSGDTNENGEYTSPVVVTVYDDDDGSLITGATVTFGTQTGTTISGQVTFSVTEKTVVTITATFGTYVAAEDVTITALPAGGIPGFELLTLVAALGVCLILFRRRKQ